MYLYGRATYRRVSHRRACHRVCTSYRQMPLRGVSPRDVRRVYLTDACISQACIFRDLHLIGMYLTAVYLRRVRLMDVYHAHASRWRGFHRRASHMSVSRGHVSISMYLIGMYCEGVGVSRAQVEVGSVYYTPFNLVQQTLGRAHAGPNDQKEKKKGKKMLVFLPQLGCLAIYVGYALGVSILSMLEVVSTPPTVSHRRAPLTSIDAPRRSSRACARGSDELASEV
jgi:hypothetical protein